MVARTILIVCSTMSALLAVLNDNTHKMNRRGWRRRRDSHEPAALSPAPRARSGPARPDAEPAETVDAVTVSVIIPTLNEEGSLAWVLENLPIWVDEVVVVDGLSTDATELLARRMRPDAKVVHQHRRGKGAALRAGFAAATGDIIVMIDADGSNDPAEIPRFVEALLAGNDFAKGSRFTDGGYSHDITPLRSGGNRALGLMVNVLFRTHYTDLCYGYNAFWRHCLPDMNVTCTGFEVETLINVRVARAGLSVAEVPSIEHTRLHGESNLRAVRDGFRVLRAILGERLSRRHIPGDPDAWHPTFHEPLAPPSGLVRIASDD